MIHPRCSRNLTVKGHKIIYVACNQDPSRSLKTQYGFVKRFRKENESLKTNKSFPATQHVNRGACVEISTLEFTLRPFSLKTMLNDKQMKEISQECEAIWPRKDRHLPVFKLILPVRMPSAQKIMKKLVTKYKIVQYKISQSVWEVIKATVDSSMFHGVQVKTDLAAGKVYLVGKSKKVTEMKPNLRNLLKKNTRAIKKKNQRLTVVVPMSPAHYRVMYRSGLENKMAETFPELKIDYNAEASEIQISGLGSEVLTAKCKIDNIQQQMKTKSLQLNRHLVQFLMLSDGKLGSRLFVPHSINALLEIDDNAVKLIAYSEEALKKAEEQIKDKIMCRRIIVKGKSLLESPEWKSLFSQLNAEICRVQILEFPSIAMNDVVISGLTSNVKKCHQKVSEFLRNNIRIRTDHTVESRVMMKFLEDRRRDIWGKIDKKVDVTENGDRMCLSGPRVHVQEAALLIKNFLSSLHCDTLCIDKPGAKKFCMTNEKVLVAFAKELNCAIHLEETCRKDSVLGDPRFQVKLPKGLTIAIYKDDLCRHKVDVIVNAANEHLQHFGGLAKAILNAAGLKLRKDCDRIIKTNGRLSPGDSVITDAGNLPCKQVIHTVGPRWSASSHSSCEHLLQKAITTSLQLASKNNHCSIAIPAVSSRIFAFPLKSCIKNIMEALHVYVESQQTTLQRIHLVDMNEETVKEFCEATKVKFGNQPNAVPPKASEIQHDVKIKDDEKPRVQVIAGNENAVMTKEGIVIKLLQKKIEDCTAFSSQLAKYSEATTNETTNQKPAGTESTFFGAVTTPSPDVHEMTVGSVTYQVKIGDITTEDAEMIVNSSNSSFTRREGVSQAILEAAGTEVEESARKLGAKPNKGHVITPAGNLKHCKWILHVAGANQPAIIKRLVLEALQECEEHQATSVAFPALGTGAARIKASAAADSVFDAVVDFTKSKPVSSLKTVKVVLLQGTVMKDFCESMKMRHETTPPQPQPIYPGQTDLYFYLAAFFGEVTTPSHGVHEMTVGSVTYQVKIGDITKEDAEMIVNSSNSSFTRRAGVSQAILEAAGTEVEESARKLGAKPNKGHVITLAGNLKHCKWILHVADANQPATIKRLVLEALQECEEHQATSVAFPALGTGAARIKASAAADSVLDAVVDFTKSKLARSLKTVKVVLLQKTVLKDFHESMKKRYETVPPQPEPIYPGQTGELSAARIKASAAADSVLDAVVDFTKSKLARSLKTVKVVLLQKTVLKDFHESMKKRYETVPPQPEPIYPGQTVVESGMEVEKPVEQEVGKPVPKLSSFHMVIGVEPVIFSLCANEKENLNKTKTWLQEFIKSAQTEKVITEECVVEIEEADKQKIFDLQKTFQVSVTYKPPDPSIQIVGLTQDVMSVSEEITVILNRIKENKNRARAAEKEKELKKRAAEKEREIRGQAAAKEKEFQERTAEKEREFRERTAEKEKEFRERAAAKEREFREQAAAKEREFREQAAEKEKEIRERAAEEERERAAEKEKEFRERAAEKEKEIRERAAEEERERAAEKEKEFRERAAEKEKEIRERAAEEERERAADKEREFRERAAEKEKEIRERAAEEERERAAEKEREFRERAAEKEREFRERAAEKEREFRERAAEKEKEIRERAAEKEREFTLRAAEKEREIRERAAELLGKVVEWRYELKDNMVPFNKTTNLDLEEAKNGNKSQITIESQGNPITVNLHKETATDRQGNQIRIQRVIKNEEDYLQVPLCWKPMDNALVMEVEVPSGSPEYLEVEQKFRKSCYTKILKILRVQNRNLWLNYQIKKHQMDTKNGSTNNEMTLFHGTDPNSIQHINHHGFNRNYAGRNAAVYGNGTYFAVKADYSSNNTYSKPDVGGQKHMYLARVLTGVYSPGAQGMAAPPAKNPANPTDLYDSVTNSITYPTMFIIFNDIQAYPEYHIIF
ncbi:protein mono-ADP-ribosyltransferase PARP14-like [Rana temporaria]|uniref:protein mono-ADP-ribosyltransferase PARP14-like n=1 Tax=Rana temporaria TaxID=8407 RepID=UPI001AAC7F56|nr:protein mono-ADP-ribosyltransferase PARP14-like [Rana temporaria]